MVTVKVQVKVIWPWFSIYVYGDAYRQNTWQINMTLTFCFVSIVIQSKCRLTMILMFTSSDFRAMLMDIMFHICIFPSQETVILCWNQRRKNKNIVCWFDLLTDTTSAVRKYNLKLWLILSVESWMFVSNKFGSHQINLFHSSHMISHDYIRQTN